MDLGGADLDMQAVQLTAALDVPLLLYLTTSELTAAPRSSNGWRTAGRTWPSAYPDLDLYHQAMARDDRTYRSFPYGSDGMAAECALHQAVRGR